MRLLEDMFGTSKPIVGMVHLAPLPGSSRYDGLGLASILERALSDARALASGGMDGLLVENYGDAPFKPVTTDPETVASMTAIGKEIVREVRLPLGVNVLRNSALAALAVCLAVGGRFIRVNVLTEASLTDQGVIQGVAHELHRYKRHLSATDMRVFADVHGKHAMPLRERPIGESAHDAAYRGMADALIVTGPRTGSEPKISDIAIVKRSVPDRPVLVGSGLDAKNARRLLRVANGAIVGTSLKVGGVTERAVEERRVRELMAAVKKLR